MSLDSFRDLAPYKLDSDFDARYPTTRVIPAEDLRIPDGTLVQVTVEDDKEIGLEVETIRESGRLVRYLFQAGTNREFWVQPPYSRDRHETLPARLEIGQEFHLTSGPDHASMAHVALAMSWNLDLPKFQRQQFPGHLVDSLT